MGVLTWMVFFFGALLSGLIIWPIAKSAGRKEQCKIQKDLENAKRAPDKI